MKSSSGRKGPPLSFVLKVRGSPEVDAFLSEPLLGPVISLLTVRFLSLWNVPERDKNRTVRVDFVAASLSQLGPLRCGPQVRESSGRGLFGGDTGWGVGR